jgi:hypothetical protein
MNDLFLSIYAVLSQWVVLMSGGIGLAITIWLRVRGKDISNKVFWAIAAFALLLGCFLAWRDEHNSLKRTEQELAQEKNPNTPRLSGQIEQVKVGKSSDNNETQVLIRLSVRNTGAPSIAEGFELAIRSGNFEAHDNPKEIPKDYTLLPVDKSPKITLNPQEMISRTAPNPIARGSLERGWLRFMFTNTQPERIWRPGMKYTVSFADISGKTYSTDYLVPENVK